VITHMHSQIYGIACPHFHKIQHQEKAASSATIRQERCHTIARECLNNEK